MLSSPEVAETGEGQAPVSPVRRSLRIDVEQLAWGGVLVAAALARLPAVVEPFDAAAGRAELEAALAGLWSG